MCFDKFILGSLRCKFVEPLAWISEELLFTNDYNSLLTYLYLTVDYKLNDQRNCVQYPFGIPCAFGNVQ